MEGEGVPVRKEEAPAAAAEDLAKGVHRGGAATIFLKIFTFDKINKYILLPHTCASLNSFIAFLKSCSYRSSAPRDSIWISSSEGS